MAVQNSARLVSGTLLLENSTKCIVSRLATIWDLIEVVNSYVGHWVSGYYVVSVTIRNNNPVPIHLYRANQNWQINKPGKYLWATYFYDPGWDILNDISPQQPGYLLRRLIYHRASKGIIMPCLCRSLWHWKGITR
jgi:hypothetical protein